MLNDEIIGHLEAEAKRLASHNPFYNDVLALIAEVRELRKERESYIQKWRDRRWDIRVVQTELRKTRAQLIDAKAKHENALQIVNHYRATPANGREVMESIDVSEYDDWCKSCPCCGTPTTIHPASGGLAESYDCSNRECAARWWIGLPPDQKKITREPKSPTKGAC